LLLTAGHQVAPVGQGDRSEDAAPVVSGRTGADQARIGSVRDEWSVYRSSHGDEHLHLVDVTRCHDQSTVGLGSVDLVGFGLSQAVQARGRDHHDGRVGPDLI